MITAPTAAPAAASTAVATISAVARAATGRRGGAPISAVDGRGPEPPDLEELLEGPPPPVTTRIVAGSSAMRWARFSFASFRRENTVSNGDRGTVSPSTTRMVLRRLSMS